MSHPRTCWAAVCASVLLLPLGGAVDARAAVPGANGPITYSYDDYSDTSTVIEAGPFVEFIKPTDGSDAQPHYRVKPQVDALRPKFNRWSITGKLYGSIDTRHVGINTEHREYGDTVGHIWWKKGAHVGSLDNIGDLFSSGPFFPDFIRTAELCNGDAKIVASLGNGTLLWRREIQDINFSGCNVSSRKTWTDYTITDFNAKPLRRVFASREGKKIPGTVFSGAANGDIAYSYVNSGSQVVGEEPGIYKVNLATETVERLTTSQFNPSDVTPDGRYAVGAGGGVLARIDLQTGEVKTILDLATARTLQPTGPQLATSLSSAVVSPDGTKVALVRVNSNDAGGVDAILEVGLDGSSPRVVKLEGTGHFVDTGSLSWQPGPTFDVELGGSKFTGDTVELDVNVKNLLDEPITGLSYLDGGAPGLRLNNAPFEQKLGLSLIGGPSPGLVSDVGPRGTGTHQYLLGIDQPGRMFVRVDATGGPAGKAPSSVRSNVLTIDAATRPREQWEQFMEYTGGYTLIAELARAQTNAAFKDTFDLVVKQMQAPGEATAATRKSSAKLSDLERGMALRLGLPENALAWMPNDTGDAVAIYRALQSARDEAGAKVWAKHFKQHADKVSYASEFWRNQVFGSAESHVPVADVLWQAASEKATKADGYYRTAKDLVSGPDAKAKMTLFVNEHAYRLQAKAEIGAQNLLKKATQEAKSLARLANDDPVRAAERIGGWWGTGEGEVTYQIAENMIAPDPSKILRISKLGGAALRKHGVPDIDIEMPSLRTVDKIVDAAPGLPPSAAKLGMGDRDQGIVNRIVKELEAEAKAMGHDIDLALSFRARNIHSDAIENGMGKIGLFSTKSGTDVDVLLGMDKRGLGKAVIYKPKLPKNLDDFADDARAELISRHATMLDEYRKYQAPGSKARKAATKNGTVYENKFKDTTTMKAEIKTKEHYYGETIALKYEKLVVDGRLIVDPKKPARWMISDFDGNAVLNGKNGVSLPPGIRSSIELRLNRKLVQAAEKEGFAHGFHGFTHNGFDVPADVHRKMVKYVLEALNETERKVMLDKYLKKYGLADYQTLLESYETGQYVIRVTRDGAEGATGF